MQVDEKMLQLQGMASVKVVLDRSGPAVSATAPQPPLAPFRNGQLKGQINAAFSPEVSRSSGEPPSPQSTTQGGPWNGTFNLQRLWQRWNFHNGRSKVFFRHAGWCGRDVG